MALLKAIGNRLFIILRALNQLACGVIWLRPDHTISGEVGYAAFSQQLGDKNVTDANMAQGKDARLRPGQQG